MFKFARIDRLPPYVFAEVNELKMKLRRSGEDIVDLGMGNPDIPTPKHIVDKLCEAAQNPRNHRYSLTKGLFRLREALSLWYQRKYNVYLDPEKEIIMTIGSKEGIAHLMLTLISPGDVAIVPNPCYPIHAYSVIIAGGDVRSVPVVLKEDGFVDEELYFKAIIKAYTETWPKPKLILVNFPHNPTTSVVTLDFYKELVKFAKENNVIIVNDLAYADITFDGYKAPSIFQVEGAKDVAVEFYTLSKSYSMAGWRVGFCSGNEKIISALYKIKSYLDYGNFQPIQIAAIVALKGPQDCVEEIRRTYEKRRDTLYNGLKRIGWDVVKPKASMFIWAKIPEIFMNYFENILKNPEKYKSFLEKYSPETLKIKNKSLPMYKFYYSPSVLFAKYMLLEGKVAMAPGIGFGEYGEGYVRLALVENEHRIRQAVRGIKRAFEKFRLNLVTE